MTVKTAAEVPSDVQKRCSLVHYGMSVSKRNCVVSNSDVPENRVEMRRLVSEYECPLLYSLTCTDGDNTWNIVISQSHGDATVAELWTVQSRFRLHHYSGTIRSDRK